MKKILHRIKHSISNKRFSQPMMKRDWTPYEKNLLMRYGFDLEKLEELEYRPVEYITGYAKFLGYDFLVNHNVLIPRVESEGLVKLSLKFLTHPDVRSNKKFTVADVGTGAGNIGISLFLEAQKKNLIVKMLMSDISEEALKVAETNLDNLVDTELIKQFKLFKSDLLKSYPKEKLDLIVANLPYIPQELLETIQKSVLEFEPKLALDGGNDGLALIKKLIKQSGDFLTDKGLMILEIDSRVEITAEKLEIAKTRLNFVVSPDQFDLQRYLLISKRPVKFLESITKKVKLT
jgi:release factor glutamine methyltransferase